MELESDIGQDDGHVPSQNEIDSDSQTDNDHLNDMMDTDSTDPSEGTSASPSDGSSPSSSSIQPQLSAPVQKQMVKKEKLTHGYEATIRRALKSSNSGIIKYSAQSIKDVDSLLNDCMSRVTTEASNLVTQRTKRKTVLDHDVHFAVNLVLSGSLAQGAQRMGMRAVEIYDGNARAKKLRRLAAAQANANGST
ncbi:hypothetical protein DM01DRAFT_300019, partial [Hesseltinella vesiculosa]